MQELSAGAQSLRQGFRYLNKFMVLMYRLGLGWMINLWPAVGGRILVIGHTGRKSGLPRFNPVNYAEVDGQIYVAAGFGRVSDWYRNLLRQPEAEIWLPDGWYAVRAVEVSDAPKRLELLRAVLIGAGFASLAGGIDPYTISDRELEEKSREYRLLRLERVAAKTGRGGPGELAWVWPVAVMALLPLVLRRCGKKGCCGR